MWKATCDLDGSNDFVGWWRLFFDHVLPFIKLVSSVVVLAPFLFIRELRSERCLAKGDTLSELASDFLEGLTER